MLKVILLATLSFTPILTIDPSDYAIKKAQKRFGNRAIKTTLSKANFPEKSFDVVTMLDVFEHLKDPKGDLRKVKKS